MPRTRSWTNEQLAEVVPRCYTYKQVAVALGLYPGNKNCQRVREEIVAQEIDTAHFNRNIDGRGPVDVEVFVKGKTFNTSHRRRYLELVDYKCRSCGISEWLGNVLILQVDHIDGDRTNNTLDNLRLLCPNCHSQTETWSKKKVKPIKCQDQTAPRMGTRALLTDQA